MAGFAETVPMQLLQKQDQVQKLLTLLSADIASASTTEPGRAQILAELKVLGRNPRGADAIFCTSGIQTLSHYAFGEFSPTTSHEASRCIANTLLLKPALRQVFIDLGLAPKAVDRLQYQNDEDGFLMSRILFLLTFEATPDLDDLLTSHNLALHIASHLSRFERQLAKDDKQFIDSFSALALTEILKLMFSVTNAAMQHVQSFSSSVVPLIAVLAKLAVPNPPLQPPLSSTINALANITLVERGNTSDRDIASKLVEILDRSISAYTTSQLETLAIPLLTVLRKLFEVTSDETKIQLRRLLLPANEDRNKPIGQGDGLPSRLLRLTASTGLVNLSECISGLMFELSDRDASKYILNIGYGFAAGYLASHSIPVPASASSSRNEATETDSVPINPITGQRLDKEPGDTGPVMTQEEKQREAERLFVIFERLQATGVMKVENPVKQAVERGQFSGKIEELSDSE